MTRRFSRTLPVVAALGLAALPMVASAQNLAQRLPENQPLRGRPAGAVPDNLRPSGAPVYIPELTEVPIVLKDDLKSGGTHPGSEVLFYVARNVYAPGGTLVIARDTPVIGHIGWSKRKNIVGEGGKLFLTADYILAQDRTRIPLRGVEQQTRGRSVSTLTDIAGALTAGVALLFIEGNDTSLHAGQPFTVYTQREVVTAAPLPSASPEVAESPVPPRVALVVRKDGTFAHGQVVAATDDGITLVNSAGRETVKASDIQTVTFSSDASLNPPGGASDRVAETVRREVPGYWFPKALQGAPQGGVAAPAQP